MNNIHTTIHISQILPLLLGGALLGIIFFVGLYWTVRQATKSAHPARYFLSSFLLRTAVALGGFYLLSDGQWPRLLAVMTGFIGARIAIITISRHCLDKSKKRESRNAP